MKENYSKQALLALKKAKETAESKKHNYIGTEHLLAGLCWRPEQQRRKSFVKRGLFLKN